VSGLVDVRVPDIGEFENVDVIEVLVAPGDRVEPEQSLITLESDKATMEIPSPRAGLVRELAVQVGSQVSEGDVILRLEAEEGAAAEAPAATPESAAHEPAAAPEAAAPAPAPGQAGAAARPAAALPAADLRARLVVLGAGPGGYSAAFRAADLGVEVLLVERYPTLGGVCLNVGCIPSKALLHIAEVVYQARALARHGVEFGEPRFDLERIRAHKDAVVGRLTGGLAQLASRRDVRVVQGEGRFEGPHLLRVEGPQGTTTIAFEHAIVAAGSRAVRLPGLPDDDPRVMDSTAALELEEVPARLLVVGGGIIGLEMAAVYHALGSRVTVVELLDQLMPGTDPDLVKPLRAVVEQRYEKILLGTKVAGVEARRDGLHVAFEGAGAPDREVFDRVLVAVGRRPNGDRIGAEAAGLRADERGFVPVDAQLRTNVPHIHAIGDLAGPPLLAHKATHEGRTAAEVVAGEKVAFDARAIPSVAYTDPEVAWMGLTELAAREQGVAFEKAVFPWSASGRALGSDCPEGATKLLLEPGSRRLLGAGIVGRGAGELIAELVVALEMGADAQDLALSVHPHPTLSESVALAAELAEGTITDLYVRRRRPAS
jgi:dihydrolipoamide dehydrogenase